MPIDLAPQVTDPQPGDIGFAKIGGRLGWWVNLGQSLLGDASPFDHTYMVVAPLQDPDWPDGLIVEAMPHGARMEKLAGRLGPGHAYARVPLTDNQRSMAYATALTFTSARGGKGVPYSFGSYLALALIHWGFTPKWLLARIAARKSLICSQLDDQFLKRLGYQLFNDGGWELDVSPGDVSFRTDPRIVPLPDSVGITRRTARKQAMS
jgi:hypothetical protein